MIENLVERPWHSYVLSSEGGEVIIGGGKTQGIKAGDKFAIVARGKRVNNPATGGTVELPGKQIAEVEVTDIDHSRRRVKLDTRCNVRGNAVLKGDALVLAPSAKFD